MTRRVVAAERSEDVGAARESAVVTVVTATGDASALDTTHTSLLAQTLQPWSWVVELPGASRWGAAVADERIRIAAPGEVDRDAVSTDYVAHLPAGETLPPTALEQWLWFLDARRECASVQSAAPDLPHDVPVPRMIRHTGSREIAGASAGFVPLAPRGDGVPEGTFRPDYVQAPNEWLPESIPLANRLPKAGRSILLLGPRMALGGSDRFNLDLLDELGKRGWGVTVVTTHGDRHEWLPLYARRTRDILPLATFLRPIDHPRFLRYLVGSRQPDVVLVANSELAYRLLPYLRATCDAAFVDFLHSTADWNNGGYPRFATEYQELLDLTVTSSASVRTWMGGHGADEQRIEVCYTGVDADALRPDADTRAAVRLELGLRDHVPVVVFAGRVSSDKQPRVLAETLRLLTVRGVRFSALVAGAGPDLPWLERYVSRHGLADNVVLVGELENEAVRRILRTADVFFLPSRSEGIALTAYDALACGVPFVGADVGGQAELVTPECGVLVERSTPEREARAYADVLAELLADEGRRSSMAAAARARIEEQFTLTEMGARMDELLALAIDRHENAPRPVPPRGVARASATETVELVRLAQVTESLWGARAASGLLVADHKVGVRFFLFARDIGGPVYRWALARGWTWPRRLKTKVQQALFRGLD